MKNRLNTERGFTLIELCIILSTLFMAVFIADIASDTLLSQTFFRADHEVASEYEKFATIENEKVDVLAQHLQTNGTLNFGDGYKGRAIFETALSLPLGSPCEFAQPRMSFKFLLSNQQNFYFAKMRWMENGQQQEGWRILNTPETGVSIALLPPEWKAIAMSCFGVTDLVSDLQKDNHLATAFLDGNLFKRYPNLDTLSLHLWNLFMEGEALNINGNTIGKVEYLPNLPPESSSCVVSDPVKIGEGYATLADPKMRFALVDKDGNNLYSFIKLQWVENGVVKTAWRITVANDSCDNSSILAPSNTPAEWQALAVICPWKGEANPQLPNSNTVIPILPAVTNACNINDATDREIICDGAATPPGGLACSNNYPAGTSWPNTAIQFQNNRVFVYGDIVVSSGMMVKVKSLCNYGTLRSEVGGDINIEFTGIFANFEEGNVIAENATSASAPGSSIKLEGTSPSGLSGIVFNEGTIKAGNAFTHVINSTTAMTFEQSLSVGGNIDIIAGNTFQYGNLSAGQGSEIRFMDFWDAWEWEHQAGDAISGDNNTSINHATPSSKGGHTIINHGVVITGNQSATSAGNGGAIIIVNNDICTNNPTEPACVNEIEGGPGGDLELLVTSGTITNTALKGNSVYVEPETIEISDGTTITADEDIVIFGGDDYLLKITGLSEGAISAGRNIILAVGDGGTIDLRGISTKAFKAVGKVEIHADSILLDDGIQLEDIIEAQEVIVGPNKILYHAVLSGYQQVKGQPNTTVPISLTVYNGGPEVDTYTLAVSSENGWTITSLPSSITIDGLGQSEIVLNVALPAEGNDTITVTATSQADPTVIATTEIRVSVAEDAGKPTASFTASPMSGNAPLEVSLNASASSDPDGTIVSYTWAASNGDTATGATASMTFPEDGVYVIVLTVTDNDGKTATAEHTINVGGCEGHATYSANNGFLHIPYVNMPTVPMIGGNHTPSQKTAMVEATLQLIDASNLFEIEEINWLPLAVTETGQCHANYSLDGKLHIPYIDVPLVTILNGIPVPLGVDTYGATLQLLPFSDLFTIESVTPIP